MLTIRRILAPTDFSDSSAPAVRYAAELADKFAAELVLLHVVQDLALVLPDAVMPTPMPSADLTQLIDAGRAGLANQIAALGLARPWSADLWLSEGSSRGAVKDGPVSPEPLPGLCRPVGATAFYPLVYYLYGGTRTHPRTGREAGPAPGGPRRTARRRGRLQRR